MPRCDIILLVWNQPEYTAACIESIFRHTSKEDRLVIVDNASAQETKTYLESLQKKDTPIETVLLRNEANKGFAGGMNTGMRFSDSPYVCLMNNDTLASDGWLDRMIEVFDANPQIGLINPTYNAGDEPCDEKSLVLKSREISVHKGKWIETSGVNGFCMAIKRAVIDKIGYLDEIYERGFFEDTDYCRKAAEAGFISALAKGAYVYHHCHKSFVTVDKKGEDIFQKNKRIFESRWGGVSRVAYISSADITNLDGVFKKDMEAAVELARKGAFVQFFFKGKRSFSKEMLFASLGLVEHANVTPCPIAGPFFKLQVLLRILKKRKKRFTKIVR